ncbi:hypothetical protein PVAP13_3KG114327 [Panicum virgatum]|uniref:Uncharacterized protein n=1 Tax=Panicum virgatum TaxID=38727 RepID=A0A8T0UJI4_PANVG|nr:hypothetical protein PVAP13_3KG114327 [Panicum virgatum]
MVKESLCVCFLTEPSLWLLSVPVLMIWGPLVLVGLHDPSQSDQKTSHGGGRRAENWRSFSSKVLAFSVPNATRLAAVPGTPHNHKYKKVHLQFTSSEFLESIKHHVGKSPSIRKRFHGLSKASFRSQGNGEIISELVVLRAESSAFVWLGDLEWSTLYRGRWRLWIPFTTTIRLICTQKYGMVKRRTWGWNQICHQVSATLAPFTRLLCPTLPPQTKE